MQDDRKGIDALAVDQHVELDDVGRPVFLEVVIERSVAARDGLQAVEEIHHHFGHRHLVHELHLATVVGHVDLVAALLIAQGDDVAEVVLRNEIGGDDDRFADLLDLRQFRQLGRVFDLTRLPSRSRTS
jgi:hypothetical protein